MSIELEEYSDIFTKNNIDGNELLIMDSARIKVGNEKLASLSHRPND